MYSLYIKFAFILFVGIAWLIHYCKEMQRLNCRGELLRQQWAALNIQLDGGEKMLSEHQQRQVITREPKFIEKLQRLESLSIQLSRLLGRSTFTLGKSPESPKGQWLLDVVWSNCDKLSVPGGYDEVDYLTLKKRVKGWVRSKWITVMTYQRDFETDLPSEKRYMFDFDESVATELDTLSDELEAQIAKARSATTKHLEQFHRVIGDHPQEERNRFDNIDPMP